MYFFSDAEGAEMRSSQSSWTDDNFVDKTNSHLVKQLEESRTQVTMLVARLLSQEQQFRVQLSTAQEKLAVETARADAADAKQASLRLYFMEEEKKKLYEKINPTVEQLVKCFKSEVIEMERKILQEKSRADMLQSEVQKYISTINYTYMQTKN